MESLWDVFRDSLDLLFHFLRPTYDSSALRNKDTYYRQFHLNFQKSLKKSNPLLDDLFKQVADCVEEQYSTWFLGQLGENWSIACAETFEKSGCISNMDRQESFYAIKVKHSDSRLFTLVRAVLWNFFRLDSIIECCDTVRERRKRAIRGSPETVYQLFLTLERSLCTNQSTQKKVSRKIKALCAQLCS